MTAAQLQGLRTLADIMREKYSAPTVSEAILSGVAEIERLAEALRDAREKLDVTTKALEARKTTAAGIEGVRFPLGTSSPDFDAWYLSLERVHPCAEFEGEADQFVVGDLVDAFDAGKALGLRRLAGVFEELARTKRNLVRRMARCARFMAKHCRDWDDDRADRLLRFAAACKKSLPALDSSANSTKGETP